jgi:hypothetical protein
MQHCSLLIKTKSFHSIIIETVLDMKQKNKKQKQKEKNLHGFNLQANYTN